MNKSGTGELVKDSASYQALDSLDSRGLPHGESSFGVGSVGLGSIGADSTPVGRASVLTNRWGTARRKGTSHAARLGYHPHNYVPEHKIEEVRKQVITDNAECDDRTRSLVSWDVKSYASTAKATARSSSPSLSSTTPADYQTSPSHDSGDEIAIEVAHLSEAGMNLDEITRYVYEHLQEQKKPNFMRYLSLDQDGGLDRVQHLWNNQRIFFGGMLLVFVGMNILYLLQTNWAIFQAFSAHVLRQVAEEDLQNLVNVNNLASASAAREDPGVRVYFSIEDPHRRKTILQLAGVVSTCEVLWVLLKVLLSLNQLRIFFFDKSEYRQYRQCITFFQESLPVLSTFSMLKFVRLVHPSLVYTQFLDMLQERSWLPDTTLGTVLVSVYFVLTRVIVAFLAVGAFAMKLLAVGLKLINPEYSFFGCFMNVGLLMNQCLGCVLFERVLQDRIFLFIFGGSDADFLQDELALKGVYRCRVAKQIWEDFWVNGQRFQGWKAFVLLATLDHFDLQMLLIEEVEHDNPTGSQCVVSSKNLREHGASNLELKASQ